MIEEQGRVVDVDAQGVWIEVEKHSACASCSARAGCGQRLLAERKANRSVVICVDNPDNHAVEVDDRVVVGIAEGAFMKASLALYLIPLILLFLAAVVADSLALSEGFTILAGITGLLVGLAFVRMVGQRWQGAREYHPVLMRVD